jgi:hypothetical protein
MAAYFGSATNPADTSGLVGTTPVALTPPGSMVAGDLVVVLVHYRATGATLAVSNDGGQAWTAATARSGNTQTSRLFWCIFDGTWDANPSFSNDGIAVVSAVMHVFRPTSGYAWDATPDTAEASTTNAAPGGSFDCTITGFTPTAARTVSLFFWSSNDDNTWALQTGTVTNAGLAQYRNDSSNDQANSTAYLIQTSAVATGNITNRQATLGGDAYHTHSIAFSETATAATHSGSGAATLPILTASGTGKRSLKGSGAPSLPLLTAAGSGKRALKGSGALSLPLLTAAGTGKKERSGSGAATLPLLTASGSGKKARSGSGAASLPLLDADGTGKRALLGSGEPELPLLTADGEGEVVEPGVSSGSGEATLPLLTASGEGEIVAATPEPPAEERSGGYPPVPDLRDQYEAQRRERLRKLRERDELEERELQREADRLESHLINEGVIQPPDDMARIRALMAQYEAEAVSNRARRAFEYAQRARSQMAYELAEREIQKLQEEEELALLMVIALD